MPTRAQVQQPIPTSVTIDIGNGASLTVTFDRNAVTTDWARSLDIAAVQGNVMAAAEGLASVITAWDLVEDDGTPVEPTPHELALLSVRTLNQLGDDLVEAAAPGAAEGNALSPSSPATTAPEDGSKQDSQTSQNGSEISPLPAASESLLPS